MVLPATVVECRISPFENVNSKCVDIIVLDSSRSVLNFIRESGTVSGKAESEAESGKRKAGSGKRDRSDIVKLKRKAESGIGPILLNWAEEFRGHHT